MVPVIRLPTSANLKWFRPEVSKLLTLPGVRSVGLAKDVTRMVTGLAAETPLRLSAPVTTSVS